MLLFLAAIFLAFAFAPGLAASNPVNTAKLSSPILLQRTVNFDAAANKETPPRSNSAYLNMSDQNAGGRRRRSSSILQVYHEPPETLEQISDQASLPNLNANWTNAKGMIGYMTLVLDQCIPHKLGLT